jgi:hypothetical protein
MKFVNNILLNKDGKLVLYALNAGILKPGISKTERFLTVKAYDRK